MSHLLFFCAGMAFGAALALLIAQNKLREEANEELESTRAELHRQIKRLREKNHAEKADISIQEVTEKAEEDMDEAGKYDFLRNKYYTPAPAEAALANRPTKKAEKKTTGAEFITYTEYATWIHGLPQYDMDDIFPITEEDYEENPWGFDKCFCCYNCKNGVAVDLDDCTIETDDFGEDWMDYARDSIVYVCNKELDLIFEITIDEG